MNRWLLWGAGPRLAIVCVGLCLSLGTGCDDAGSATSSGGGSTPDAGTTPDAHGDVRAPRDTRGDDTDVAPSDTGTPDASATPDSTGDEDVLEACAPENQCASLCCQSGQLCLREQCVSLGAACAHNLECSGAQICEPSIGRCIPDPGVECTYQPETDIFEPRLDVAWSAPPDDEVPDVAGKPSHHVMMAPAVIDLNEDGIPDIIFTTFAFPTGDYSYEEPGTLRAIDGKTYAPIFNLTELEKRVSPLAGVTVGDIDGDGRVEIVAPAWDDERKLRREIIAFDDHTTGWRVLWKTDSNLNVGGTGSVGLADLDGDGRVEVYGSNFVLDARTGGVLCTADGVSGGGTSNPTAADLDGDGKLEVINNYGAFKFAPDENKKCPKLFTFEGGQGEPAVGDFGTFIDGQRDFGVLDGIPEIVTVNTAATSQVRLHNGQDGSIIWSATMPISGEHPVANNDVECAGNKGAGPPTIADFDGDGVPEVGTAGACYYVVFEADGTLKWKSPTQDYSSRTTGSSVFDFQGDGKAEVVYADECFVRVYDGSGNGDGTTDILYERPHTSNTGRELPVIVDVDNNFHADIVAVSNNHNTGLAAKCARNWDTWEQPPGFENGDHGVLVLKDAQDRWVTTRPVWNQHSYHVTNVCDGLPGTSCPGRVNTVGAIPIGERKNWTQPGLNNFRQNVQGEGLFNAPDLAVTNLATDCGTRDGVTFHVTISNLGTRGVVEGTDVALYVTYDGVEQYLTTLTTSVRLLPGGAETLSWFWADAPDPSGQTITVRAVADADEQGQGQHFECNEDNNEMITQATCGCSDDAHCNPGEICVNTGECIPRSG